jgi:uncharacterized membrane protein
MSKHRLELFSDGIYAIIMTLLVLDLKVPLGEGLSGLKQATPSLLVHALTFFVLGGMWLTHQSVFALLDEINGKIIRLNLVGMFWVTLIPFGAKVASEQPLEPLGVFMLLASYCFAGFALRPMANMMSKGSESSFPTETRAYLLRRRRAVYINLVFMPPISAALTWVSPWFGYAGLAYVSLYIFLRPTAAEQIQKIMKANALTKVGEPEVAAGS